MIHMHFGCVDSPAHVYFAHLCHNQYRSYFNGQSREAAQAVCSQTAMADGNDNQLFFIKCQQSRAISTFIFYKHAI
uniref:Uncharacterized protein n=1 Tax=Anguilla anguilla TaxID=7936 RepID=A0A0E9WRS7_ANGAN